MLAIILVAFSSPTICFKQLTIRPKSKLGMSNPAPTQRKQNYIDAQVQGALLKRI